MDGYQVCRQLKAEATTQHIPIIFLTAKTEAADETLGLEIGAADYLTKPVVPAILRARVAHHLQLKAQQDFLRDKNAFLEQEIRRRTQEVTWVQDVTIMILASLAETRDSDTGHHIRRTQHYVRLLAESLSQLPQFQAQLTPTYIDQLFKSAPLHDIGKVGIPDAILLKAGPLTIAKRIYKPAFSHAKAVDIIQKDSGHHFNPLIVEHFLKIHQEFAAIAQRFADPDT